MSSFNLMEYSNNYQKIQYQLLYTIELALHDNNVTVDSFKEQVKQVAIAQKMRE